MNSTINPPLILEVTYPISISFFFILFWSVSPTLTPLLVIKDLSLKKKCSIVCERDPSMIFSSKRVTTSLTNVYYKHNDLYPLYSHIYTCSLTNSITNQLTSLTNSSLFYILIIYQWLVRDPLDFKERTF